jgi:hypothetical protein
MTSGSKVKITNADGSSKTVDLVQSTQTDFFGDPEGSGNVRSAAVDSSGTIVGSYNPPNILTTAANRRLSGSNRLLAGLAQKNEDRYL